MIEAILFDAEGVVIDTESLWDRAQEIFLTRREIVYDRDNVKPLLTGRSMIDGVKIMKSLKGYENLVGDDNELARERAEIAQVLFKTDIDFIGGFKDFHSEIRHRYSHCISTAMHRELLRDVDLKLGLSELFNGNLFSIDDVGGKSKPEPDIFLYSAKQLRVKPENCVVIEDSPKGITAAKRAGMYCIGLTTTYPEDLLRKADMIVSGYDKLKIYYE